MAEEEKWDVLQDPIPQLGFRFFQHQKSQLHRENWLPNLGDCYRSSFSMRQNKIYKDHLRHTRMENAVEMSTHIIQKKIFQGQLQ